MKLYCNVYCRRNDIIIHYLFFRSSPMGLFLSCIRSRKPARGRQECEPLLDSELEESQQLKDLFRKLVDIVAALDAGKLPSQHQLNHLIKVALKSEILHPKEGSSSLAGHKVLLDVREILGLLAVFGLEKNCRYRLQVMRELNHNLIILQTTTRSRISYIMPSA